MRLGRDEDLLPLLKNLGPEGKSEEEGRWLAAHPRALQVGGGAIMLPRISLSRGGGMGKGCTCLLAWERVSE